MKYDPKAEYGRAFSMKGNPDIPEIIDICKKDVKKYLPKGKVYEIRFRFVNNETCFSWYHIKEYQNENLVDYKHNPKHEYNHELIGIYKT